jgi:hypothetical protein
VGRTCTTHGREEDAYRVLVGKLEEKRQLIRSRRRWEGDIKMDLREIEWGGMTGFI